MPHRLTIAMIFLANITCRLAADTADPPTTHSPDLRILLDPQAFTLAQSQHEARLTKALQEQKDDLWNNTWGQSPALWPTPGSVKQLWAWVDNPAMIHPFTRGVIGRLLSHDFATRDEMITVSRRWRTTNPRLHQALADEVVTLILLGQQDLIPLLHHIDITPDEAAPVLLTALSDGTPRTRLAAMRLISLAKFDRDDLPRSPRSMQVKSLALLPALFDDLRAQSKDRRIIAAKQLDELDLFPKSITAALIRATEAGDAVVREGLVNALEDAFKYDRSPNQSLELAAAQENPATRAYARGALRALKN